MSRRVVRTGFAVAAFALLATPAVGANGTPGGRPLSTTLTGAAERPGPGDPDGSGAIELRLNSGKRLVCYRLTYTNIGTPTAAHIHKAGPNDPGPIVVGLGDVSSSPTERCVTATRALIKAIRKHPEQYYVNVHNANPGPDFFPAGNIRGQLSK